MALKGGFAWVASTTPAAAIKPANRLTDHRGRRPFGLFEKAPVIASMGRIHITGRIVPRENTTIDPFTHAPFTRVTACSKFVKLFPDTPLDVALARGAFKPPKPTKTQKILKKMGTPPPANVCQIFGRRRPPTVRANIANHKSS